MSQQNHSTQSRQASSYPSPHSYPSPSMSAYAYPQPTSGQSGEPYRASPTASHVSLPPLSLPPIRNLDGIPQQQQQQQQQPPPQQAPQSTQPPSQPSQQSQGGPAPMGSPLPHPMNQMSQYYHNQGQSLPPPPPHMSVTSDPNQPVRYPLPAAPDARMMSGGRHKKEIKRRTKTGCLTCRKRRIKCDEAHPTCRNCQKSKRDCLGYDPIFKSQPGPAAIQPAPSSAPSMQPTSSTASQYPPLPQGYVPAVTQPYAPSLSAGVGSPDSSVEHYDYGAPIDPALEGAGTSQMQVAPNSYKGAGDGTRDSTEHSSGKRTKIEELLAIAGVFPPPVSPQSSLSPAKYDDIKQVFSAIYAPGLDKFLETRWFHQRGLHHLLQDYRLCGDIANLLDRFKTSNLTPSNAADVHENAVIRSLEAKTVWSMMDMCRQVANRSNTVNGETGNQDVNDDVHDAAVRVDIFEKLVSGDYFDTEPPPQTGNAQTGKVLDDQLKRRELDFWRLVGRFCTLHDDEASSAKEIDKILAECRNMLDSRENRDMIYSVAIARHIGQRVAEFPDNLPPPESNNEGDVRARLYVAKRFIEEEAMGKGTTQVIQRLCGMAMRSWTLSR